MCFHLVIGERNPKHIHILRQRARRRRIFGMDASTVLLDEPA